MIIFYPLLKGLGFSLSWSPYWMRRLKAKILAILLMKLKFRKKIILKNLQIASQSLGLSMEPKTQQKFVQDFYFHFANLCLEILMHFGSFERFVKNSVEVEGFELYEKAKNKGKGVIIISSHLGNWEVMSAAVALKGMDALMVTKFLKPQWLHDEIERSRHACGIKTTYEPRTLKDIIRQLSSGGAVGIMLDQYTGPPVGVRVPFMGVVTGTHTVAAMLARKTQAPVLMITNYRLLDGRFKVIITEELPWLEKDNAQHSIASQTALYAAKLEELIRFKPEQWLWTHHRFKGDLSPLKDEEWTSHRVRQ